MCYFYFILNLNRNIVRYSIRLVMNIQYKIYIIIKTNLYAN